MLSKAHHLRFVWR